jgi:hypothetical protein
MQSFIFTCELQKQTQEKDNLYTQMHALRYFLWIVWYLKTVLLHYMDILHDDKIQEEKNNIAHNIHVQLSEKINQIIFCTTYKQEQ